MDINAVLAEELKIKRSQVDAAVGLIDEGNTIPFIARYRKEKTGSLNDEVLRTLDERLKYLRNLEDRKTQIISSIEEQGKLTDTLKSDIEKAETLVRLEDLYRPYKQKRKTRASVAREKGLAPFAQEIRTESIKTPLEEAAKAFVSEEKGVKTVEEAIAGAKDIIAEEVSDRADLRGEIRGGMRRFGRLISEGKDKETKTVYETYYAFSEGVAKVPGYRILAINRGEKEDVLSVKVDLDEKPILDFLTRVVVKKNNPYTKDALIETVTDSYHRLIEPSIEREVRNELTEKAEDGAMQVFAKNLRQLLMQSPLAGQTVLGWDPAFRTGCKLAVVDPTGKVLDTAVIFPTAPTNPMKIAQAKEVLKKLIRKYKVTLISVGNGTASRESEQFITEFLHEIPEKVAYVITNEAGASVYSASALATEEFPNFDVGQRSAASIARRAQDPLAELVKIDPKAIGVGQYQHDMNQKRLGETLSGVVEACVNEVGVDLNTASAALLSYVAGVTKPVAKNIVAYREENGRFVNRSEIKKVPKLGPKAFEQCAGFLRISGGKEPLDQTAVHPENYKAAKMLMKELGVSVGDPNTAQKVAAVRKNREQVKMLSEELGLGTITLVDILKELEKPGRDPREEMPGPILRHDVMSMSDLKEGMILKGTVRNVVDFGAFVDIGVHEDGLVHISQLNAKRFVKHPLEVVSVGDIVEVKVLGVDEKKKRISLTMIL